MQEADQRFFERLVQEICGHVSHFPPHLSAREVRASSTSRYYHQRQDFFTKRTENDKGDDDE